jgi:hypothetical protein
VATTPSSLEVVPALCAELEREPLFHMSLGSKELFHSNLIAWLVESHHDRMRRVFEPWLVAKPKQRATHAQREYRHLDLVLRFEDCEPLVIENKVFSVPRRGQLEFYGKVIDGDRSLGPAAPRVLLSPCPPPRHMPEGWAYIFYRELAERLRSELGSFGDGYVDETVRRYSDMVDRISTILALAADVTDLDGPWLFPDPDRTLFDARLYDGCAKLRADAIAAELEDRADVAGISDRVYTEHNFTNKSPLVSMFQRVGAGENRVGWQLQGDSWRLAAVIGEPALVGRTAERRAERERWAEAHIDWFDFAAVEQTVPGWRLPRGAGSRWNRYDPDFIYRSRRVPGVTVGMVLELGMTYARRAAGLGVL